MHKLLLVSVTLLFLFGCSSPKSSTGSYIKIIDKGITGKMYWVLAENPYNKEDVQIKISVGEENTWNLVEKGREYLAIYDYTSLEKGATLLSIQIPASPQSKH